MRYSCITFLVLLIVTSALSQKLGKHTLEEWQTIIDTTWGEGLSDPVKVQYFDIMWNTIDDNYPCFPNLDIDWNAMKDIYRPEIEAGVSRGRFAAIMIHLCWRLMETHVVVQDTVQAWGTTLDPGIPLFVTGQPGRATHFGAALSPLDDSSLVVIKVLPDHPLGLIPGDVILGYDGRPWKDLYKEIMQAEFPIYPTGNNVATKKAQEHNYLISAGMNWHLFDTLDVVQYMTGDTLHFPTGQLAGQTGFIWANEQLDVPGVPWPNVDKGDNVKRSWELGEYISSGIIEDTQIGYIYLLSAVRDDIGLQFVNAIDNFMNDNETTGLIIDFRLNIGGNISFADDALALLFNTYIETAAYKRRCNTSDHFQLCSYNGWPNSQLAIKGDPNTFFDRPIAVLTGPGAHSMGDVIPLQLKFHPMTRLFGKPTAGGFSRWDTQLNHLPNTDWYFGYTLGNSFLLSDPDNYLTHTDLPIDEEIWLTRDDVANGEDTVVKRAIEWINNLAYAHDVTVDKTYLAPASGDVQISAQVQNPNEHDLSVLAYISLDDTTVVDSVHLTQKDSIWSTPWSVGEEEKIYHVSVKTDDADAGTSRTIPNVAHFTTVGPVVLADIPYVDYYYEEQYRRQYIHFILKNEGLKKSAEDLNIHLSTTDQRIEKISTNNLTFPDLTAGETDTSRTLRYYTFDFIEGYNPDSTIGKPVHFAVTVYSNDIPYWTDNFEWDKDTTTVDIVIDEKASLPKHFSLLQNYPNPFNPKTMISYQVGGAIHESPVHVELSIFNLLGQKVATLVDKKQAAGSYQVQWDGSGFASGVYLYRLTAEGFVETKKLVLLK